MLDVIESTSNLILGWVKIIIEQRKFVSSRSQKASLTGHSNKACPYSPTHTSYEMILRAAEAEGIEYEGFQEEFDLDLGRTSPPWTNNFGTVAAKIKKEYSRIDFAEKAFSQGEGAEKVRFIEEHIAKKQPILVSITNEPFGHTGWHIMPVVDLDGNTFTLLEQMLPNGSPRLKHLTNLEIASIHDNYGGGWEVAYLRSC